MTSAFRTSSFLYSGNRLVYDDFGEGERLVVYLHALLLDSEINRGIARALARQWQSGRAARSARARPQ